MYPHDSTIGDEIDALTDEAPTNARELDTMLDSLAEIAAEYAARHDQDPVEVAHEMGARDVVGCDTSFMWSLERVCHDLMLFTQLEDDFDYEGDDAFLQRISLAKRDEDVANMDVTHHLAFALQTLYGEAIAARLPTPPHEDPATTDRLAALRAGTLDFATADMIETASDTQLRAHFNGETPGSGLQLFFTLTSAYVSHETDDPYTEVSLDLPE